MSAVPVSPVSLQQRLLSTEEPLNDKSGSGQSSRLLGTLTGVFIPTCENMWGVVIFLRFQTILAQEGLKSTLIGLFVCMFAALTTTSCLSAIASSGGPVSEGSPYYMISRALGLHIGATIGIIYWFGISLLAVMESLGAVEVISLIYDVESYRVYLGGSLILILSLIVWKGIKTVSRIGYLFAIAAILAIILLMGFLISNSSHGIRNLFFTWGLSKSQNPSKTLGLLFTCYSGIFSGADRAHTLRNSDYSIKVGTFSAVFFSSFLYLLLLLLWSFTDLTQHLSPNHNFIKHIFYPFSPIPLYIGVFLTCTAQVLQCLVVAPRILYMISKDKVLPFLNDLSHDQDDSSSRPLLFTGCVCILLTFIGSLDFAANLVSMCFLICYAFVSLSCLLLTILQTPTWRPEGLPKKRNIFIAQSFFGVISCGGIMIMMDPVWATFVVVAGFGLYFYIHWLGEEAEWGSGLDGLRLSVALSMLSGMRQRKASQVNWRPHILAVFDMDHDTHRNRLVYLASHLKCGRGLVLVCAVSHPNHEESTETSRIHEKFQIQQILVNEGLTGFAEIVYSKSVYEALPFCIQLSGLGVMRPNTLLLSWPNDWRIKSDVGVNFVRNCKFALDEKLAILSPLSLEAFPDSKSEYSGFIDLWWFIQDGGLLLCLAWLLTQHAVWQHCRCRIFIALEQGSVNDARNVEQRLKVLLNKMKILTNSSIHAVILTDRYMLEPYVMNRLTSKGSTLGIPYSVEELLTPITTGGVHAQMHNSKSDPSLASHDQLPPMAPPGTPRIHRQTETSELLDQLHDRVRAQRESPQVEGIPRTISGMPPTVLTFERLNRLILSHSLNATLIIINLPDIWSATEQDCLIYLAYCECMTQGLDRVLFVHSAPDESLNFL
jgi:solute carrier family 12 (potassium/chloride transporter), member 4/6